MGLSIFAFPSPAVLRLEADGSVGCEPRMENQERFLCGVVEGKGGRLQTSRLTAGLGFPVLSAILNGPPLDPVPGIVYLLVML